MRVLQSSWQDATGTSIHTQDWETDGRPRAVVAVVHGLGDHIARYAEVGETLTRAGFTLMGFDLRGHGRSGGRRGHTPSYETFLQDVDEQLGRIRAKHPRAPIFLYGHSMGGGIVLNYALRRRPKLKGIIATSPWLRRAARTPPLKEALARFLEPILPTYTENWGVTAQQLSRDPSAIRSYEGDDLAHGLVTVSTYRGCLVAGEWALAHASEFSLPLLLMHGTADPNTSWEASREFAESAGRKCRLRLWDGAYHELHHETMRKQVLGLMVRWMNGRLET